MGRVHPRSHAEKIEGGTPVRQREALPHSLTSLLCSHFCAKGSRGRKKRGFKKKGGAHTRWGGHKNMTRERSDKRAIVSTDLGAV